MDLRSLEYFVAVAEELSFTRAAARCHISQPSISASVQTLERELGEPLFDRLARGIELAAGGRLLLPHARRCLEAAEAAQSEFSARAGLLRGELRLGTVSGVERTVVPDLLGTFHRRYPGVDVTLRESTSTPLLDLVTRGALDAAIVARPLSALPAHVSTATLLRDQLMAVFAPETFPLGPGPVAIEDLLSQPVITYDPDSGLRAILESACASAGVALHVRYAANDVRLQLAVAAQHVGVAVSAGSDPALSDLGDLVTRPLAPPVTYEKILVWRNDVSPRPTLRVFLQLWTQLRAS